MAKTTLAAGSPLEKRESGYFELREKVHGTGKLSVAQYIVDKFLQEGDSILLDAGTSLYPIADEIAGRAEKQPDSSHFTIMTHNYRAFQILIDKVPRGANLNVVLAGGRYDRDLNAMFGPQTITAYDNFFPRVVIIGISGMVADLGLFCHGNTEELAVKEVIFSKVARDRVIVADYTKLGLPDALRFGLSNNLGANVERCIVVTDEPEKDAPKAVWDRFQSEREKLEKRYSVEVRIVTAAHNTGTAVSESAS